MTAVSRTAQSTKHHDNLAVNDDDESLVAAGIHTIPAAVEGVRDGWTQHVV